MQTSRLFRPGRRGPAAVLGLASIGFAAACAVPGAIGGEETNGPPLRCEIVASGPTSARSLVGRISGTVRTAGTYEFNINRRGAAGDASVTQSGTFSISPGRTVTVGSASFAGDPASLQAELVLRWEGGTTRCRSTGGTTEL